MGRPLDPTPLKPHPAIGNKYRMISLYGRDRTWCASVTCPKCNHKRWYTLYQLRQFMKRDNFHGHCRPCGLKELRSGFLLWAKGKGFGRNKTSGGYITLRASYLEPSDLPMFRAMTPPCAPFVLEHRWNMAKHIGRPLKSWECIDHRDGDKTNNAVSNLRIYVRGKNQEGSCNGHGTYYHEWQMALREIRKLKQRLKHKRS